MKVKFGFVGVLLVGTLISCGKSSDVEGKWVGECKGNVRTTAEFSSGMAKIGAIVYADTTCSAIHSVFSMNLNGKYSTEGDALKMDFTGVTSIDIKPHTDEVAKSMNTSNYGGLSGWAANETKSVDLNNPVFASQKGSIEKITRSGSLKYKFDGNDLELTDTSDGEVTKLTRQ